MLDIFKFDGFTFINRRTNWLNRGKSNSAERNSSSEKYGNKPVGAPVDCDRNDGIRREDQDDDFANPIDFSDSDRTCTEIHHENHKLCKYRRYQF